MSVWQTPQASRRTSTSPARGSSRSTSCTASGAPNSPSTAARILIGRAYTRSVLVVPPSAQTREEWRPGVQTLLRVSAATGARDLSLLEQWHEPGCGAPTHVHRGV